MNIDLKLVLISNFCLFFLDCQPCQSCNNQYNPGFCGTQPTCPSLCQQYPWLYRSRQAEVFLNQQRSMPYTQGLSYEQQPSYFNQQPLPYQGQDYQQTNAFAGYSNQIQEQMPMQIPVQAPMYNIQHQPQVQYYSEQQTMPVAYQSIQQPLNTQSLPISSYSAIQHQPLPVSSFNFQQQPIAFNAQPLTLGNLQQPLSLPQQPLSLNSLTLPQQSLALNTQSLPLTSFGSLQQQPLSLNGYSALQNHQLLNGLQSVPLSGLSTNSLSSLQSPNTLNLGQGLNLDTSHLLLRGEPLNLSNLLSGQQFRHGASTGDRNNEIEAPIRN